MGYATGICCVSLVVLCVDSRYSNGLHHALHCLLLLGLLMSCILAASICVAHQLISGIRSFHEFQHSANRRLLISEVLAGTSAEHGHPFSFGSRPKLPTFLFGMQSFLSAIIMLILMTFNGYLILSCAFGSTFGYYWFYRGHDLECH